jgi:hypothetical protein
MLALVLPCTFVAVVVTGGGAEILERRYPVILRRFELRQGSGGQGKHKGGEGVVREVGAGGARGIVGAGSLASL